MSRVVRVVLVGVVGAVAGGFAVSGTTAKPSSHAAQPAAAMFMICYHLDGSRWACPDSMANPFVISAGSEVVSAAITARLRDGRNVRATFPAGTDAVFLTPAGIEILAEHYDGKDITKARAVRQFVSWAERRVAPARGRTP